MIALLRREFKEFFIREPISSILNIVILVFILSTMLTRMSDHSLLYQKAVAILIPLSIIVLANQFYITRQFYKDRIKGNIEILLAVGLSPFQIWIVKSIVLCSIMYIIYIISLLAVLLFSFYMGYDVFWRDWNNIEILIFFLFSPLAGMGITAFQTFLVFLMKKLEVIRVFFFFMFFLLFYVLGKFSKFESFFNVNSNIVIIVFLIVFILGFLIPFLVLRSLHKEQFIS